jgi:hypothetical protein
MRDLSVWLFGKVNPIVFEDIEEFHETRKYIKVIQETMYTTTTTVIYKQSLQRWTITETR